MKESNFFLDVITEEAVLHIEDTIEFQLQKIVPVKEMTNREKKRIFLLNSLYNALKKRCMIQPPPDSTQWISTRSLAEDCKLGIYQARSLLLKLAEQRKIIVSPTLVANSLRWYITVEKESAETHL